MLWTAGETQHFTAPLSSHIFALTQTGAVLRTGRTGHSNRCWLIQGRLWLKMVAAQRYQRFVACWKLEVVKIIWYTWNVQAKTNTFTHLKTRDEFGGPCRVVKIPCHYRDGDLNVEHVIKCVAQGIDVGWCRLASRHRFFLHRWAQASCSYEGCGVQGSVVGMRNQIFVVGSVVWTPKHLKN